MKGFYTMASIQTPTLVVELGSTPLLAEKELCSHLLSLSDEDRESVAFVHIDTADESGDLQDFHKRHAGRFRRFPQKISVPIAIDYSTPLREPMHTYMPLFLPRYWSSGAGEIRNNGHVAGAFDYHKIKDALENGFRELENLRNRQNEKAVKEIQVCIVAFLGGGTGSGIIGDITLQVRQMLIHRGYAQHIILFCALPDAVQGVDGYSMDWRKSNATASLLEIVALSLVGEAQQGGVYQKYLLDEVQEVQSGPIANEIYLYGRTAVGSIEGTMSIVALDLFQRITDGGGVGELEHNAWMGRHALSGKDDRGLPTMFGTSCPLAVIFPAQEVALAYAQLSARHILPKLVNVKPPPPQISEQQRQDWLNEWRDVALLEANVLGKSLAVTPPRQFSKGEFDDIEPGNLDGLQADLEQRQIETDQQIAAAIQVKEAQERQSIKTPPQAAPGENSSPAFKKVNHLRLLEAEYAFVLAELKKAPKEQPPASPQWQGGWWYALPLLGKRLKAAKRESLRAQYNTILEEHAEYNRYNLLVQKVEELLLETRTSLHESLNWFILTGEDLESKSKALAHEARSSGAWQGRLNRPHPHQRHIYDLNSFYDTPHEHNRAAERLYLKTTCSNLDERTIEKAIGGTDEIDRLVQANIVPFISKCVLYLTTGRYDGQAAAYTMDAELERHSRESLVENVVRFFYEYYMDKFSKQNLFDLLRVGSGQRKDSYVDQYLYEHLYHIKGLTHSMIGFQESLSAGGRRGLPTNLYLGMYWENESEEAELRQAVNRVGVLNDQNQTPELKKHDNPHRLHVLYGQHGVSLSMIQEFYRDTNSMMASYIRHQSAWYGDHLPQIFPNPAPHPYGNSGLPVHNCGKKEELVCNPAAFGYDARQPHSQRYTTSLIGRVIREATGVTVVPVWNNGTSAAAGAGPAGGVMAPGWSGTSTGTPAPGNAPGPLPATPPVVGVAPMAQGAGAPLTNGNTPGAAGSGAGAPTSASNPPSSNPMPGNPSVPNPAPGNPQAPNQTFTPPPWFNSGP
jgi:Tubulin like